MKILIMLMVMVCLIGTITAVQAAWPVEEFSLDPEGSAFEVNPDAEGWLWISDYYAGVIWWVNPLITPAVYTKYVIEYNTTHSLGYPSDARRSGEYFWWVDGVSNFVGRAAVADGSYILWQVDNAQTFCCGTAIDSMGRFWVTEWTWTSIDSMIESGIPHLFQVSVNSGETISAICTFTLPDSGGAEYLAYDDPYLWLGDKENSRILRLDVTDNHFTSWDLPIDSNIFDLVVDAEGDLWLADLYDLVEFDPDTQQLFRYPIPLSGAPQMVTVEGNRVWYTGYNNAKPAVGAMYPTVAEHDVPRNLSSSKVEGTLIPSCQSPVSPLEQNKFLMDSDNVVWGANTYTERQYSDGWNIFEMPVGSNPWGIDSHNELIFVVDYGRQVLAKFPAPIMDRGSLSINKSLSNPQGAPVPSSYQVNYDCGYDTDGVTPISGQVSIGEQSAVINDIPVGNICSVEENPPEEIPDYTWGPITYSPSSSLAIREKDQTFDITVGNAIYQTSFVYLPLILR